MDEEEHGDENETLIRKHQKQQYHTPKIFQDAITVIIPLDVTADLKIAIKKTRAKRIMSIYKRFPSLKKEAKNLGIFFFETFKLITLDKGKLKVQSEKFGGMESTGMRFIKTAQLDNFHIREWMCDILSNSLHSTSYIQIYNTLLILNRLLEVFPQVKHLAEKILESLKSIKEKFGQDNQSG